jgi:hypothetical protein
MERGTLTAADLAEIERKFAGERLGAEFLGTAADDFPVFRAPNRRVARSLKREGYQYGTWWTFDSAQPTKLRGWH